MTIETQIRPFQISARPIDAEGFKRSLADSSCGACVVFEGWVRDHNEDKTVVALEYEAFEKMAVREGEKIVRAAVEKFEIENACCVHRLGRLEIGDIAVWIGVVAAHRADAFKACEFIIDEIKTRVPIWKKEFYADGDSGWVRCEHCAHGGH